jgi:hypothetical protein
MEGNCWCCLIASKEVTRDTAVCQEKTVCTPPSKVIDCDGSDSSLLSLHSRAIPPYSRAVPRHCSSEGGWKNQRVLTEPYQE